MKSFSFAHRQTVTEKNYVFVDGRSRHKRLKVSKACERCRKRRIKCDTVKTDTWPCSQCIKLQIDCVLPNGSDSKTTGTKPMNPSDEYQQTPMKQQKISNLGPGARYATRPAYPDAGGAPCPSQQPGSISHAYPGADTPPGSMLPEGLVAEPSATASLAWEARSDLDMTVPSWKLGVERLRSAQQVGYTSHPITPTISTGPVDSRSGSPVVQSLFLMSQETQAPGMPQNIPLTDQPGWNPSIIFGQWNMTFGTPTHSQTTTTPPQTSPRNDSTSGATEAPPILDTHAVQPSLATGVQRLPLPQYSTTPVLNFVTPAMWQEPVASVYEGGTNKRPWGHDSLVLK